MSAVKARWEEEFLVLLEEMRRTTRFFKFHHHRWLRAGEEHEEAGREGQAAYARK